jgi:hypothetical protein
MWSKADQSLEDIYYNDCIKFISDHVLYGQAMREVVYKWENSMINFLTNKSINRNAYLGQCAVCYKLKIPEYIVRKAWKKLSTEQMNLANLEAINTIKEWELWYKKKLQNISSNGKFDATKMAYQMMLQLK